jgi:hypothetical protein
MNRLAYMFYGQPPAKGAPPSEALRWVRRFYIRPLPLMLALAALIILWGAHTWALVALGLTAVAWTWGFTSLNRRIRREERREQGRA